MRLTTGLTAATEEEVAAVAFLWKEPGLGTQSLTTGTRAGGIMEEGGVLLWKKPVAVERPLGSQLLPCAAVPIVEDKLHMMLGKAVCVVVEPGQCTAAASAAARRAE
jgi:hypothetical protein